MFRLIARLLLIPLVFLSSMLMVIRAQPYDDRALRDLLLYEDCAKPCFIGIQPGITQAQEAIERLRANAWVSRVGVSESLQTVAWFWNQNRPSLLNAHEIPAFFYENNAVSSIRLYTTISLGDLLLTYGDSTEQRVAFRRTVPYDSYRIDLYYLGDGYVLNAIVDCHNFWNQPTQLILGERPQYIEAQGYITTSMNKAKHAINSFCRRNQQ